jgi:hypothetical protein
MHVVPTVEMQPRATLDAFEIEAGFDGDPARRQIVHRVCQFQPLEPDVIERPRVRASTARDATSSRRRAGIVQYATPP